MLKHILVTLDGSELAETALPYARAMLAPDGKLTLLSVLDVPEVDMPLLYDVPMMMQPKDYNQYVASAEKRARDYLRRSAEQLQAEYGLSVDFEFDSGDAATVIINRAKAQNVDAIVMSTHGRSGISRWLLGSVTQKVLSAMPCPVFVVPGMKKLATQERPSLKSPEQIASEA